MVGPSAVPVDGAINEEDQQGATISDPAQSVAQQPPVESSGLFSHQTEVISQLEIDSNRSDNDSSLGSEISS